MNAPFATESGHVVIVGQGAIGAALNDSLARMPEVRRMTLIDMDVYSEENLQGQSVSLADVGVAKARAQARRIRQIRKGLSIAAYMSPVEDLPLAALHGDLICACLDSRVSRMVVNEAAWRLGIPWVDGGVLASERLARVEAFVPGPDAPCLECSFNQTHYDAVETRNPCHHGPLAAATNAPAYLGAHAASLMAHECRKVLAPSPAGPSRFEPVQVVHDLNRHELYVSRNRRNPDCRFDHKSYAPKSSGTLTIGELLRAAGAPRGQVTLSAPGRRLATIDSCARCGRERPTIRCVKPNEAPLHRCKFCGERSPVHPSWLHESLRDDQIPAWMMTCSPRSFGLRAGDLLRVSDAQGDRHYLLGGPPNNGRKQFEEGNSDGPNF